MTNIPQSLADERIMCWEHARDAMDRQDWPMHDRLLYRLQEIDAAIASYDELPNVSIQPSADIKAIEVTALGDPAPGFIYLDRNNTVHCNGPEARVMPYVENTPDPCTSEAELYFDVTGRKRSYMTGYDVFHYSEWGYLDWRKEYEATGQSFAFDKMMELYDGQEPEKPSKSEAEKINWRKDTPLVWVLVAMIPVVIAVLCMAL